MERMKLTVKGCLGQDITIIAESFASSSELISTIKDRAKNKTCHEHNIFHPDWNERYSTTSPGWRNFNDSTELEDKAIKGITNDELVRSAKRYGSEAFVTDAEKLSRRVFDVCGDEVDVARFLTNEPECMLDRRRAKVRSKILHFVIDPTCYSHTAQAQQKKVGEEMIKMIIRLELAGYRVKVDSIAHGANSPRSASEARVFMVNLKSSGERVNIRRILYPITDVSWTRGIQFGYECSQYATFYNYGLERAMTEDGMAKLLEEFYHEPRIIYLPIDKLLKMNPQEIEQFLMASVMG